MARYILLFVVVGLIAIILPLNFLNSNEQEGSFWTDRQFEFVEVWPHISSQLNHVNVVSVVIYEENGNLYAFIYNRALAMYPSTRRVIAQAIEVDNTIELWYIADEYGTSLPPSGFSEGTKLLTLAKEEEGVITIWGRIRPVLERYRGDGIHLLEVESGFYYDIFTYGFPPERIVWPEVEPAG